MRIIGALVGFLILVMGVSSPAAAGELSAGCAVTECGVIQGTEIASCFDAPLADDETLDEGGGNGAGLPLGQCATRIVKTPCTDIPECGPFLAQRRVPTVGLGALLLLAGSLAGSGLVTLRRRRRVS
jgi:hypothetical protein